MDNRKASKFMLFLVSYYVAFVVVVMPLVITVAGVDQYGLNMLAASPWFLMLSQVFGLLMPLVIWTLLKGESLVNHIPRSKMGGRNMLLVIVISFLIQPTMMAVSGLTTMLFPNQVAEFVGDMGLQHSFWLMLLGIAVTPAIVEELVLRGYIQTATKHFPLKKAALINGLFFAIIHFNMQQFFYAFVMGIVFMVLVHYTGSILAGIVSHFIINGSQVTMLQIVLWGQSLLTEYELAQAAYLDADSLLAAALMIGAMVLVTLPITIILFRHFIQHNVDRMQALEAEKITIVPEATTDMVVMGIFNNTAQTEDSQSEDAPDPENILPAEGDRPQSKFDPYALAVVGVFVVMMLFFALL